MLTVAESAIALNIHCGHHRVHVVATMQPFASDQFCSEVKQIYCITDVHISTIAVMNER